MSYNMSPVMKTIPLVSRLLKTVIFINNSSTPVNMRIRVMSGFGTTTILNKPVSKWCMCNFTPISKGHIVGLRKISCVDKNLRIVCETISTIIILISNIEDTAVSLEMLAVCSVIHAQHLSGEKFDVSSYPNYVSKWTSNWENLKIIVWKLQPNNFSFIGKVTCKHSD